MKTKSRLPDNYIQNYREDIGKRIRNLREEKGYSQDDLAEMMEIQRSTISKIENGKFGVSIDYLVKFAWYLDFDIALLPRDK
ncbi:MAG: helix-turn-helix transcriptional regulator [Chitinophagaceae bacterium]|nr:helix-turn-helix transcriptional regulator [Chitinophagaceae bacterium]